MKVFSIVASIWRIRYERFHCTMLTMKHGLWFWKNFNNLHYITDCYPIVVQIDSREEMATK